MNEIAKIDSRYICARDNYSCQGLAHIDPVPLIPNQILFKKVDKNGETIDSNFVTSCKDCVSSEGAYKKPSFDYPGRLIAVTGPMYSQKSGSTKALYNKYCANRRLGGNEDYIWVKPQIDDRAIGYTKTHDDDLIQADLTIDSDRPDLALPTLLQYNVVAFDEAQFYSDRIIYVVHQLLKNGCLTIVNGLKLTAKRDLFGAMPYLLAEADDIVSLKAICNVCETVDYATRTKSFDLNSPSVKTGGSEQYYAVCPACDGGDDEKEFVKKSISQQE